MRTPRRRRFRAHDMVIDPASMSDIEMIRSPRTVGSTEEPTVKEKHLAA
jgi:hypothetical protein